MQILHLDCMTFSRIYYMTKPVLVKHNHDEEIAIRYLRLQ